MVTIAQPCVLLIDDDNNVRQGLLDCLQNNNYRTLQANGGKQALAILEVFQPDVIVLDWTMPGFSGEETLWALKNDLQLTNIPILLISGNPDAVQSSLERTNSKFFPTRWLGKPFTFEELLLVLRDMLT